MWSFTFARIPHIHFGAGKFNGLAHLLGRMGNTALIVTGAHSLEASGKWEVLSASLEKASIPYIHMHVKGEPSPGLVDDIVAQSKDENVDVVAAIGGGSVIDTGKAISAMIPQEASVVDYLEGVGTGQPHNGVKVPFVAVPTTSGAGSEATKNAVLSRIGAGGFKKSLRHDNFIPDVAVIDPELTLPCPPDITAACGMDAFTQLLESYVSTKATPMTDALALSGIAALKDNLVPACTTGAGDTSVRAGMAYAALLSGITLANAGLGIVHGLAAVMGGYFHIPHGVVCGTLVAPATGMTIDLLKARDPENSALHKYAKIGALLTESQNTDVVACCGLLLEKLDEWTDLLQLPLLSDYGIQDTDLDKIIAETGNKNNPVALEPEQIRQILLRRMES